MLGHSHYQTDPRLAKEAEVAGDMDESLMLKEEVKDLDVQKCKVTRSLDVSQNMFVDEISIQRYTKYLFNFRRLQEHVLFDTGPN